MIKNLKIGLGLIILGEVLGYFNGYFLSDFSDFTTGLLLGLSVGMKLVGIILSLVGIIQVSNDNKWNWLGFYVEYFKILHFFIYYVIITIFLNNKCNYFYNIYLKK